MGKGFRCQLGRRVDLEVGKNTAVGKAMTKSRVVWVL